MNKTYGGLVSSPINQKELNISYSNTYTFGGTVAESIPQQFKPTQQDEPVTPIEPEPQPEQVHLFEVYANQECTERPQVGSELSTVYVKCNASWSETNEFDGNTDFQKLLLLAPSVEYPDDTYMIHVYVDFVSDSYSSPVEVGSVIECDSGDYIVVSQPLKVSFGAVVDPND